MSSSPLTSSASDPSDTTMDKATLRRNVKRILAAISPAEVQAQSALAQETLISLPQYQAAKRISIYLSMPTGEAQTDLIVRDAFENGKKVFVPYIYSASSSRGLGGFNQKADGRTKRQGKERSKVMDVLRLQSVEEYEGLSRDAWGIPSLPSEGIAQRENSVGGHGVTVWRETSTDNVSHDAEIERGLDLVVMPGVAFDPAMVRLGHGAGFYDEFLTRCCRQAVTGIKRPLLVGLCLTQQFLPRGRIVREDWDWRADTVVVGDGRVVWRDD